MAEYTSVQLNDLETIRQAIYRYSTASTRLDADWMKSAFWPDATDTTGRRD